MRCWNRKHFPMAAGISVILAAILVLPGCGNKKEEAEHVVFYVNEEPVTREEYELLAREYSNQIYRNYSTEQVNREDFWITEIDGEMPYQLLDELVTDKIVENYNLKTIAAEEEIIQDYTYQDLMGKKEQENQERKARTENEEVIYGVTSFDDSSYYEYWYSNLETQVINAWIRENGKITEKECREYYHTAQEKFSYDVGVTVLYGELGISSEEKKEAAWERMRALGQEMDREEDPEKLSQKYADIYLEKLELNSLDTQEGKSGVYAQRWEIASQLEQGQIFGPYEQEGAVCILKCLERTEQGKIEFDEVKNQIERYLQIQAAGEYIQEEKEKIRIRRGTISPETIISQM